MWNLPAGRGRSVRSWRKKFEPGNLVCVVLPKKQKLYCCAEYHSVKADASWRDPTFEDLKADILTQRDLIVNCLREKRISKRQQV